MVAKAIWSLKKRAYRVGSGGPVVCDRLGARWLLDPTDWLDLQILIKRPYEERQFALFCELCRAHQISHFVDCGANFGLYSVLLPRAVAGIERVDCFEPQGRVRWRLIANLGLNGLYERATVHPLALSDKAETFDLYIDPRSSGVSAISPSPQEASHREFSLRERVESVRFDDYLRDLQPRVAVKIDVEGHELDVLGGMTGALRHHITVIQVESRDRNRQALATELAAFGFSQEAAVDDDLYFVRR